MKYCKSCLYPETAKPTIYFNDDGICSGCTYNLSREDKDVNWKEREELFRDLAERCKEDAKKITVNMIA